MIVNNSRSVSLAPFQLACIILPFSISFLFARLLSITINALFLLCPDKLVSFSSHSRSESQNLSQNLKSALSVITHGKRKKPKICDALSMLRSIVLLCILAPECGVRFVWVTWAVRPRSDCHVMWSYLQTYIQSCLIFLYIAAVANVDIYAYISCKSKVTSICYNMCWSVAGI